MTTQDTTPAEYATNLPDAAVPGAGDGPPATGDPYAAGGPVAGGAGMAEENAPAGFTADVAGGVASTDDPDEARDLVVDAAKAGPRSDAEQAAADRTDAGHGEDAEAEAGPGADGPAEDGRTEDGRAADQGS